MALTFKNLGIGTLGTGATTIVAQVTTGKSVLVDNLILFNRSGGSVTVSVDFVRLSPSTTIRVFNQPIGGGGRFILEPITLSAGDKLIGQASAGSALDFTANGVMKDL